MPEDMRIQLSTDLTPEGFQIAEPLMLEMLRLEQEWVSTNNEEAYEAWRAVTTRLHAIVKEHYAGPSGD
jgi:hypothetical protein